MAGSGSPSGICNPAEAGAWALLGMIIGEQGFISPPVRDELMATGTVHIISISGSHFGLIVFLLFFLIKGLCRRIPAGWLETLSRWIPPTRLAVVATIPLVTFYTLLVGAEVATVRSLVMIVLFLVAVWLGHERNILIALAVAALLALIHDPGALYDISFQLSYLSVFAIALAVRWSEQSREQIGSVRSDSRLEQWKSWDWARQYLRMTVAVTLATIPFAAYYFNQIAWLGLVANVVVVPMVEFLVLPLGLLSAIWVLITGSEVLPMGGLPQTLLDLLADVVSLLAEIPGAMWHVASPAILAMVAFYVLLVMAAWWQGKHALRWGCALGVVLLLGCGHGPLV